MMENIGDLNVYEIVTERMRSIHQSIAFFLRFIVVFTCNESDVILIDCYNILIVEYSRL